MPISSRATLPKSGKKAAARKSSSLPAETVEYLKAWMMSPEHIAHPYPTEPEKAQIMADTGIELKQLTNWFVNNRKRYWKPRVEARLQQQARAAAAAAQVHAAVVASTVAAVSPEQSFKPTLTALPPSNGFVTFDLSATRSLPMQTKRSRSSSFMETDMQRVLAFQEERIVSESSSSGSVSTSASDDGNVSDAASAADDAEEEEEEEEMTVQDSPSIKNVSTEKEEQQQQQDDEEYASLQTTGESSSSVTILPSTLSYVSLSEESIAASSKKRNLSSTRTRTTTEEMSPRKKFRRVSIELWRETCQKAAHIYDDDALPSLEEATQLFGYGQ